MSKVKAIGVLKFTPSDSTDVTSRRLYFKELLADGSNNSPLDQAVDQSIAVVSTDNGDGTQSIDLAAVAGLQVPHDGTVRFATSPVDAAGNEGDLSNQVDVPFDLTAPDADTNLVYVPAA